MTSAEETRRSALGQDVAQGLLGELERQRPAGELREGEHAVEQALELAHVAAHLLGEEEGHVVGQRLAARLGLAAQDDDLRSPAPVAGCRR
jgi:hypothetical protein